MMLVLLIAIREIIYISIFLGVTLTFLVFSLISNHKNKSIFIDSKNILKKEEFLIKIALERNNIKIYGDNGRKKLFSYQLEDAYSLLEYKDVKRFEDWLHNVLSEKNNPKENPVLKVMNPQNSNVHWMKLSLLSHNKNQKIIYAKLSKIINDPRLYFADRNFKIMDPTTFYNGIKKITNSNLGIRGQLIVLRLEGLDLLRKRYGMEMSNLFLLEIWKRLNKQANANTFVTYLNSSLFCIYKSTITEIKQAQIYLKELFNNLSNESISILKYATTPTFKVGMTMFGEYTYDLKQAIKNASQALEKPNIRDGHYRYGLYDYSFEKENLMFSQESEQLVNIIKNRDIAIFFSPFVDLQQTNLAGFFIIPASSFLNFADYETNIKMSARIGMKAEFLKMIYKEILDLCYLKSKKRYRNYINMEVENLKLFKEVITSSTDYQKLRIFLVLKYSEILDHKNYSILQNMMAELYELNINFAVYADESMLTITSKFLSKIEAVIFDEKMIVGIENDDLKYLMIEDIIENTASSKMRYLALGVSKYAQAAMLQKAGLNVISGDFVTRPIQDIDNIDYLKNRNLQALNNKD